MADRSLEETLSLYRQYEKKNGISEQLAERYIGASRYCIDTLGDVNKALELTGEAKRILEQLASRTKFKTLWNIEKAMYGREVQVGLLNMWYDALLIEAQNKVLDSYLLYLEKNRNPRERFYAPKRVQFMRIGLVQGLQDLIDDKLDLLSISLPPASGKTTMEKFFHSAVCGWYPEECNLFFSHSAGITRMYYDGVLDILTNDTEYTWKEIFPHLSITSTNAKMEQINVGGYKPFQNVQTASVGSEMAGKVRASKFLFVDDMIGKIEEALNIKTLDKLWGIYSVDARQRKTVSKEKDTFGRDKPCKEVIIATRWSVHDPIGRLQRMYEGNDRCRFIAVPDIDPVTGLSNFDFEFGGFSVEFYHDQELLMDEISYRCLYKNEPIEREGLLYHEDELRRYLDLPERDPDAIIGVCDTKAKGTDFMVLPCFYKYGQDYYLVDTVCDDTTDYNLQKQKLSRIIMENDMQQCEFESNSGGDRLAHEVQEILDKEEHRCNITTKPTETNKETRIIVNSDWVKKHCLFKTKENYLPKSDYGRFMSWMLSYSVAGKNEHDDVADCLANFALFVNKGTRTAKAEAVLNPFRGYGGYY